MLATRERTKKATKFRVPPSLLNRNNITGQQMTLNQVYRPNMSLKDYFNEIDITRYDPSAYMQ